jgi:TatD DNase family protein
MLSYTDAHLHLQDAEFNGDRDAAVKRALDAGVKRFVCAGISPEDWPALKQLARQYPQITAGYGVHPWYVDNLPSNWQGKLKDLLDEAEFAGETGLDKQLAKTDFSRQLDVFEIQLSLAANLKKPAVIHCLKAHNELLKVLNAQENLPAFILHAYSGSSEMAKEFLNLGAYFSFGAGALRDGSKAIKCVKEVPLPRLLVETDSPFMAPAAEFTKSDIISAGVTLKNGRLRNEPANIELTFRRIAQLRQMPLKALCGQVEKNISAWLLNQSL